MSPPIVPTALPAALAAAVFLAGSTPWVGAQEETGRDENPPEAADADPEWTIVVHRLAGEEFANGFTSPERGFLRPPEVPAPDAGEEELRDFLRRSTGHLTHLFDVQGFPMPEGTVFAYDPDSSTLAARLPANTQRALAEQAEASLLRTLPSMLAIDSTIVEGEAESIRRVIKESGSSDDHGPLLSALTEAPGASIVATGRLETRSGQRAKIARLADVGDGAGLRRSSDGWHGFERESVESGTVLEVDPVLGPDGKMIDLIVSAEHHFSEARRRLAPVSPAASPEDALVRAAVLDTDVAHLVTATTIRSGATRLVGAWTPEGAGGRDNEGDRLQALFLAAAPVPVLPAADGRLAQWIERHGDDVAAIPPGELRFPQTKEEELPPGMIVRRFRISLAQFRTAFEQRHSDADSAADPFAEAPSEPGLLLRATVAEGLKAAGIPFPPGASANYLVESGQLVVRNTPENVELVAAFLEPLGPQTWPTVAAAIHLVQADARLLQRLSTETLATSDHEPAWREVLEAVGAGTARILRTTLVEARSGQRAVVRAGRNHGHITAVDVTGGPAGAHAATAAGPEGAAPRPLMLETTRETEQVGVELEIDPVVGPDGRTIDIGTSIRYDHAPPTAPEPEAVADAADLVPPATTFHETRLTTMTTVLDGSIRLLGVWKAADSPQGGSTLQAAFLRVHLVPTRLPEARDEPQ